MYPSKELQLYQTDRMEIILFQRASEKKIIRMHNTFFMEKNQLKKSIKPKEEEKCVRCVCVFVLVWMEWGNALLPRRNMH